MNKPFIQKESFTKEIIYFLYNKKQNKITKGVNIKWI